MSTCPKHWGVFKSFTEFVTFSALINSKREYELMRRKKSCRFGREITDRDRLQF